MTATFKRIRYDLTVLTSGTGTGTVTSSPAGLIDCPVTCVATLDSFTVVTLTATPTAPATFAGWSGACTGTGSCVVTMDAAKTVTASFSTPPVADDQSVSTAEETPLPITLTATDADNDPLTFSIVSGPANGTLGAVTGANVTYTPSANFNGTDSFTFVANDGTANSNTATVTITVTPVADAPVANSQSVSTGEDTPLPITLTASDGDGDPLTYSVLTGPTNGTLGGSAPNVTYTPAADYSGPDSFTFTVNDSSVDSNVATVTIMVNAVNDPPVATPQGVTLDEDGSTPIVLTSTDTESDPVTYSIVTPPINGTVSAVTGTNVTYTPAPNFNGPDSFTFVANDGTSNSNVATVTITVTPVADAPVANDQAVNTAEDTPLPITLTASDGDNDPLTYRIVTQPTNGTLSAVTGNTVTYTPNADYTGPDSFTFVANDDTVDSNVATVTITVTAVNDPPVATPQGVTLDEDTSTTIVLTATDAEGAELTYSIVTPPNQGTVSTPTGNNVTYTPNANYNGLDSFTFVANDGTSDSNVATVTITVSAVNDPPDALDDTATVAEDSGANPINVLSNDTTEPDTGETLSITAVTQGTNGVVNADATGLTYTPNAGFNGSDSFTYTISDGNGGTDTATVTVTVNDVNDPPTAVDDEETVAEDSGAMAIAVLFNDSTAPDSGETLTITDVTQGTNGAVAVTGGGTGLTYAPNADFNGADSFTYTISDGNGGTDIATVTVTVTPVNDPPVANAGIDQTVAVSATVQLDGNGSNDVEGALLTYQWSFISVPVGSAATLSATNVVGPMFVADQIGTYEIQLIVNDGAIDSPADSVTITAN